MPNEPSVRPAERLHDSGGDSASSEVEAFTRECEALRVAGCRCMLKWDGPLGAVPLSRAEAAQIKCPVHFIGD